MAKPSEASIAELERCSAFSRAGIDLLVARGVVSESMAEAFPSKEAWSQATQGHPFSAVLAGAREGAHDMVRMLEYFLEQSSDATLEEIDAQLAASGAPALSQMRSRLWELVAKVLRRRAISSETEYRAVIELLSDVGPRGPSRSERDELNDLVSRYERSAAGA